MLCKPKIHVHLILVWLWLPLKWSNRWWKILRTNKGFCFFFILANTITNHDAMLCYHDARWHCIVCCLPVIVCWLIQRPCLAVHACVPSTRERVHSWSSTNQESSLRHANGMNMWLAYRVTHKCLTTRSTEWSGFVYSHFLTACA